MYKEMGIEPGETPPAEASGEETAAEIEAETEEAAQLSGEQPEDVATESVSEGSQAPDSVTTVEEPEQ